MKYIHLTGPEPKYMKMYWCNKKNLTFEMMKDPENYTTAISRSLFEPEPSAISIEVGIKPLKAG